MDEAAGNQPTETGSSCHNQQHQQINLNEIKNLSDDEFKQQLLNWIETNCVAKTMQSKLRKDLIDNFNRTSLGRQIAFQHQQSHRIVLSSLILALNTLVAEFLYAQNCHFSLSVFSTEVPYKNTMPDFENVNNFRFSMDELNEIFEALGLRTSSNVCKDIIAMYSAQGSRVNTSLLYGIFKVFTSQIDEIQMIQQQQPAQPVENNIPPAAGAGGITTANITPIDTKKQRNRRLSKTTRHQELNVRYFKHLSSYLDLLAKHIIEMNRKMENLKTTNEQKNANENSEKLDKLNQTLDKITENLTNLSKTNRQGKKLSAIIKSIRSLTTEIERCSESFQQLSTVLQNDQQRSAATAKKQPKTSANSNEPSSYAEWLNQFNASPFSKIYLADIERTQRTKIDQIRAEMTKDFDEKMEINRRFIRLHYKEKMLEKCKTSFGETMQMNRVQRENFNEMIDNKLKLVKDLKIDCVQRQNAATLTTKEIVVVAEKKTKDIGCGDGVLISRTNVDRLSLHKAASINIEAVVRFENKENEEQTKVNKIATPESSYPDYVVQYARQRLQELEDESERLDKSFQSYLQRQEQEKHNIESNVTKIWEKYAIDKQFLNQTKDLHIPKTINMKDAFVVAPVATPVSTLNPFGIHRSLAPDKNDANDSSSTSPLNLFQNPYRQISIDEIRLAKTMTSGNKKKMIDKKIHTKPNVPIRRVKKTTATKTVSIIQTSPNEKSDEMNKEIPATLNILPTILSINSDETSNHSDINNSAIVMKNDDDDNQMITDTKEPEPEPDDEILITSQISAVNLNESLIINEEDNNERIAQIKPTASATTFLINRNQSNDFMINDDYINDVDNHLKIDENDDVLSIGEKNSDSSDDFWK